MSDESLEQPSPLRCVPSFATGGTAMSELTRAQLMELANNMCGLGDYWGRVQQLLDHDAAQRERIAELEAADEIHLQMHDTARQQLTTLQARVQAFLDHDAAQRERIAELEQALRLHLAVSPDDPVLITPVEQQLTTARRDALEVAALMTTRACHHTLAHSGTRGGLKQR
jgi:hypothetical protein